MKDITKCSGEGCPLKDNCKRYLEGIGAIDWFVSPMYKPKKQSCELLSPLVQKITKK